MKQAAGYAELEDLEDFIDDDLAGEDWRSELQSVTGYDPTKCVNVCPYPLSVCTTSSIIGHPVWSYAAPETTAGTGIPRLQTCIIKRP